MPKIVHTAASFALLAASILAIALVVVPAKGAGYCEKNLHKMYPEFSSENVKVESTSTRTFQGKWTVGLLYQPVDLSKDELTVVCTFESTNYVFEGLQMYRGNQLTRLKKVSGSNYSPTTWFK